MRKYLFLPSFILPAVLFYMPTRGVSEGDLDVRGSLALKERRIVRLTDEGIQSSPIVIKKEDSSAFFLNETSNSQVSLEIDVVTPSEDCASRNMKSTGSSVLRSSKAVGPTDFATVCFLNRGTYNYTVFGLRSNPSGLSGSIIVE